MLFIYIFFFIIVIEIIFNNFNSYIILLDVFMRCYVCGFLILIILNSGKLIKIDCKKIFVFLEINSLCKFIVDEVLLFVLFILKIKKIF